MIYCCVLERKSDVDLDVIFYKGSCFGDRV